VSQYARLSKRELVERLEALERERQSPQAVEHRMASTALRDSEERIRGIVETAVEGIVTIDEHGIIASVNPATEELFGYRRDELVGHNVRILMPSPDRERHDTYLANYLRTGHARIIGIGREVLGRKKDGTVFPMDLSVGEFKLASGRMFAGILRDITERKRLEKEVLEISESEQQRIGQDLHDGICQQLVGIELICQTLEEDLREEAPQRAEQAREIARHVREAIRQTRGLSRGLSPVDIEAGGLNAALRELADSVQELFKVRCMVHCAESVDIGKNSVATHLYRIAQEAINNAVRHGKAAEIVIFLESRDDQWELRIADNGCGIADGEQPSGGMGMRSMGYRAKMIGGSLEIHPAPKHGTVVTCRFPCTR
jgi:two-component system, LuxR family, sensor kinase FixL